MQTLPDSGSLGSNAPEQPVGTDVPRQPRLPRLSAVPWERLVTLVVVVGTTVFLIVELNPGLLFGPNLDVGGDNAAHVVAVYYLIHDLLPHGQLAGWDPQWFDGFPLYVFYFPLPALLVALLNVAFPYAVAFKLISVLGIAIMPGAAYLFGRLAGWARPVPALMCVATLPFIFSPYYPYQIDGGNLLSTLAGEFSFTLALSVSLIFLGVFAYALRTGRLRWLAALLFCATILCHVVPALFAAVGALAFTLAQRRLVALRTLLAVGVVGGLLAAFWLLRFGVDLRYSTCMCYTRVPLGESVFPKTVEISMQILALIGAVIGLVRRDARAIALGALALLALGAFALLPSGVIYNGRWLPFWFLMTDLLAAYAFASLAQLVFRRANLAHLHASVTALVGGGISIGAIAFFLGVFPFVTTPSAWLSVAPGWLAWNNSGYQAKPDFSEFSRLIALLDRAGKRYGCGRLDYEYSPNTTDAFGSTLVPMSFPYWTNGCIDTTEGVYYESSTSTPFHFLDQAELSVEPSNPMVGIPYQSLNVADGIRHLQLTGVQYFLANSPTVEGAAAADPALIEIASMPEDPAVVDSPTPTSIAGPRWILYKIRNSALVTPLRYLPIVEAGLSKNAWQKTAIAWYQDEQAWSTPIATGGPSNWQREPAGTLITQPFTAALAHNTVSKISMANESLSFHVSRIGVPVLVKVPYFPNWQATGATGPYEVTPNLMVVIPSAHTVSLVYGTTTVDWTGRAGSVVGLVGVALLVRRAPVPAPAPRPSGTAPEPDEPEPDEALADDEPHALEEEVAPSGPAEQPA